MKNILNILIFVLILCISLGCSNENFSNKNNQIKNPETSEIRPPLMDDSSFVDFFPTIITNQYNPTNITNN